jgi:hypothetical protein
VSRFSVATEANAGGDRIYLDDIGLVSALRYSTSVNGDLTASWQMYLDPRATHRALAPGRRVRVPLGSESWRGIMVNAERGDVWDCTATGWPALADSYTALAATTDNGLKLDEVVDAAIARGLPWTRPSALPALTAGLQESGFGTITEALNTVCDAKARLWVVGRDGAVTTTAIPTTVAYILQANDTAGGRSPGEFVTDVQVTYFSSSTYAPTTITRSATTRPYGRFEATLDITDLGPIALAQAQERGDSFLAQHGARLQFARPFTVAAGQLLNVGGQPVDLGTVEAKDGLVRVMLTDPDTAAGELSYTATNIALAETDYDVDADVITLTPFDRSASGFVFA